MTINPYEPPSHSVISETGPASHWYHTYVVPLSYIAFWFGAVLLALGTFMTFYPGSEVLYYSITIPFIGSGCLIPKRNYRIASILLVAAGLFLIYGGYQSGVKHQERLRKRPTQERKITGYAST